MTLMYHWWRHWNNVCADTAVHTVHSCKQSHLPFSAKMAAWPGPMNRPSFFNTSDPPDKKWILKSWTFPSAHLHWSSPPHPCQGRVQSWRSSDRRGSHRWSRSPCNSRTSSQTGNRNPRSFSHIFTFHLKFWPHVFFIIGQPHVGACKLLLSKQTHWGRQSSRDPLSSKLIVILA